MENKVEKLVMVPKIRKAIAVSSSECGVQKVLVYSTPDVIDSIKLARKHARIQGKESGIGRADTCISTRDISVIVAGKGVVDLESAGVEVDSVTDTVRFRYKGPDVEGQTILIPIQAFYKPRS